MNEAIPYLIRPNTLTEAMELAKMISQSTFCPKDMRAKPGDVLLAMQMGSEVGLSPMQALQNIAVINGRPTLWGDGALAVVISSSSYEYHKEWEEGSIQEGTLVAHCLVKRKGAPEYTKSFSMIDAKKSGLWTKPGVWSNYPNRMLQMRARAFAIRDQFADALKGLQIREEVEDYSGAKIKTIEVEVNETDSIALAPSYYDAMANAPDMETLKANFAKAWTMFKGTPQQEEARKIYEERKEILENEIIQNQEKLPDENLSNQ